MPTQDKTSPAVYEQVQHCIKLISCFKASTAGDRYLFAGFSIAENGFIFQDYVFEGTGDDISLVVLMQEESDTTVLSAGRR